MPQLYLTGRGRLAVSTQRMLADALEKGGRSHVGACRQVSQAHFIKTRRSGNGAADQAGRVESLFASGGVISGLRGLGYKGLGPPG